MDHNKSNLASATTIQVAQASEIEESPNVQDVGKLLIISDNKNTHHLK